MQLAYAEALQSSQSNPYVRRTVAAPNRLETNGLEFIRELPRSWDNSALEELRNDLKKLTGAKHVIFAPSCRSALAQVLSVLPQSEVVMPAFTCPVLKTAVEFAAKSIRYVDVNRKNLNATAEEFEAQASPDRILLATHLFGIPTDIEEICDLAHKRGCLTIEDAAAALGTRRNGRTLGTFADIGVFSFERSKRFPAFRGAAIIINNDHAIDPSKLMLRPLVTTTRRFPLVELVFAHFYNAATQPWIYGRIVVPSLLRRYAEADLAMAERPENPTDSLFYIREFHPYQAALVRRSLRRIDRIRAHIEGLVSQYETVFSGTQVQTFSNKHDDKAGLLRFPVVVPRIERAAILRWALSQSLYLETNYERPLPPEDQWKCFPNSLWASQNLILLPLYSRLTHAQAHGIATEIAALAQGACATASRSEERNYATQVA
jgi:dTDP-4-amino-4,6-dideoxygalactose transaminase